MVGTDTESGDDDLDALLPPPGLDVAQLEAWASSLVAAVDDLDAAIDRLASAAQPGTTRLLAALAVVADEPWAAQAAEGLDRGDDTLGTAEPVDARVVTRGSSQVVVTRWRHTDATTHCLLVELADGAVASVRVAAGDLFDSLDQEADLDQRTIGLEDARRALADASAVPSVADDDETWANAALARRRLQRLGVTPPLVIGRPVSTHEGVDPDPDAAAFTIDLLERAVSVAPPTAGDLEVAHRVADRMRPIEMRDVDADTASAVAHLEWADWLGAVLGLVRAGAGSSTAGADLVGLVNRCPEVTTSIPRSEQEAVASCFDAATAEWEALGVASDGALTERGIRVLPAALAVAARREGAGVDGPMV